MTTIELDDGTARALTQAAQAQSMSVEEFVRLRVLGEQNKKGLTNSGSQADFNSELDGLLFSGSSLPAGFSRSDIYSDQE